MYLGLCKQVWHLIVNYISEGLGKTSEGSSVRRDNSIQKPAAQKTEGSSGTGTRLKECAEALVPMTWQETGCATAHGGVTSLDFLMQHPELSDNIHVIRM